MNGGNGAGAAVQAEPEEAENGEVNGEAELDEELEPDEEPQDWEDEPATRTRR